MADDLFEFLIVNRFVSWALPFVILFRLNIPIDWNQL